jgi:lipopolysaccharide transport system permease protein
MEGRAQDGDAIPNAATNHGDGQLTIITPPPAWPSTDLGELWRFRGLCLTLAERSIRARYRDAVLGIGWVLLQPILFVIVFTVFFGLLGQTETFGVPYPIYFLTAMVIWRVVARIFGEGGSSVIANAALVQRVYFPRVCLPVSVAVSSLADLLFMLLALGGLLLAYGTLPDAQVVFAPLFLVVAYIAATGVALLVSAFSAEYRDIEVLNPFLTQLWFFLSPIVYSSSIIPEQYRMWYYLNPIAFSIDGLRWAVTGTPAPPMEAWFVSPLASLALLVGGYLLFRKREPWFADVL